MTDENGNKEPFRKRLQRLTPLHMRALPPLDAIRRSVAGICARWPDVVRKPEDRDREKLALDMLSRVKDWCWENITTQRAISAAVAVFDEDRRTRPDLALVHEFYVSEIGLREPGAFLDGMVGIYIDSFLAGSSHTQRLAGALAKREGDLGGRHRKLKDALPNLFHPEAAPLELARVMLEADDAYARLQAIGLSGPHTAGLAKAAQEIFIQRLSPDLAQADAREKLFHWLTPDEGSALQSGAGAAVEALLSVWRDQTPPDALRNELCERIIAAWNDPRLHAGGIWSGFDPTLRAILLRWLTHQDMKFFCDMVTATQNSHMWPPRRNFWLKLYDEKMIDEAWVAFGSEARRFAQQSLLRNEKTNMNKRFARQLDRSGSTSLLIMRIGNKIVVDGCHNYSTHIFRKDDPRAPKLYDFEYHCDRIRDASIYSKRHNSISSWSSWVLQHV